MPILTIKIVNSGTPEYENGKSSTSTAGHMWYTITNDNGVTNSYGFAPQEEGEFNGDGDINPRGKDDNQRYAFDSETGGDYSKTISISNAQYNLLKDFGELPQNYGFDRENYNALYNSCVDFTWKALEVAGLNPTGFQGDPLPTDNINNIGKINPSGTNSDFEHTPNSDKNLLDTVKEYLNGLIDDSHTISSYIQSYLNSFAFAESNSARRADPLTLDLDGDGIELVSVANSTAFFDLDVVANSRPLAKHHQSP